MIPCCPLLPVLCSSAGCWLLALPSAWSLCCLSVRSVHSSAGCWLCLLLVSLLPVALYFCWLLALPSAWSLDVCQFVVLLAGGCWLSPLLGPLLFFFVVLLAACSAVCLVPLLSVSFWLVLLAAGCGLCFAWSPCCLPTCSSARCCPWSFLGPWLSVT